MENRQAENAKGSLLFLVSPLPGAVQMACCVNGQRLPLTPKAHTQPAWMSTHVYV